MPPFATSQSLWFPVASYGLAALAYGAVTAVLMVTNPGTRQANWVTAAAAATALWASAIGLVLLLVDGEAARGFLALDVLHLMFWVACILSWLAVPSTAIVTRRGLLGVAFAICLWVLLAPWAFAASAIGARSAFAALAALAALGIFSVERVLKHSGSGQGSRLRLLGLALAGVFGVDLIVYLQAVLVGDLVPVFWQSRGIANALLGPFIVLAIQREAGWEREITVSRQAAFYTASVLGLGAYLLTMGMGFYVLGLVGGVRGETLQILFLVAALGLLGTMVFSSAVQARVRVFLIKHFYKHKYDYRQEWLQLTESLGQTGELRPLAQRALEAMARIVGSRRGQLWLDRRGTEYEWVVSLEPGDRPETGFPKEHPLPQFLASMSWVVDSDEYAMRPERYGGAFGDPADRLLPAGSIVIPLEFQGRLNGFVILEKPAEVQALNFEDHDILKTAGSQVAVVLAQALAQDQLAETRQFEAINRLSAFLMHDLKNLIAQQELVVANAQKFRHRQEFIDDSIATIRAGLERMKRLVAQLKGAASQDNRQSYADASKVLLEVRSRCADRKPIPEMDLPRSAAWVTMDAETLSSCMTHLIRNAQDATSVSGTIEVSIAERGDDLEIAVRDTGCGMESAFIRDRLFRPFDSTKGTKGMGIGVYQVRDAVRSVGGSIEVESEVGVGSLFRISIPRPKDPARRASHDESVAS